MGAASNLFVMTQTAEVSERPVLLLVNLGTPDAPTPPAVRRFLAEFLSDGRVIEWPRALWWPILHGIVLRVRPARVARQYEKVWTSDGSPLLAGTLTQVEGLRRALGEAVEVRHAMRYGSTSIREVLDDLFAEGYRRVALLPAYPQYTASTVATVNDEVAAWIRERRDGFEWRLARSWATDPAYVEALARVVEDHWAANGPLPEGGRLVLSFHSIPVAMERAGDPYRQECEATADALIGRLGIDPATVLIAYQSVFGPAEWLGPATIDTMRSLGGRACARVDVVCPGFVADCLETLEEIDGLNREEFLAAGGGEFHYLPWANGSPACLGALESIARDLMSGWIRDAAE